MTNPVDAQKYGIEQGDWCGSRMRTAKFARWLEPLCGYRARRTNREHQWWYPELNKAGRGFDLSGVNCLVTRELRDRHCGASYLRAYPVKIYKATPENSPFGNPCPCGNDGRRSSTTRRIRA